MRLQAKWSLRCRYSVFDMVFARGDFQNQIAGMGFDIVIIKNVSLMLLLFWLLIIYCIFRLYKFKLLC